MRLKFVLIILFLSLFIPIQTKANNKDVVLFNRCVDGDTAIFLLNDEEVKVRFLAIDTPETVHPSKENTLSGKTASDYTCTKITNAKTIELEYDNNSDKTDKYNRTLAWVWIDNNLLQKELIELGLAEVKYNYGDYLYTNDLYETQIQAQNKKIGIWKDTSSTLIEVIFKTDKELKKVYIKKNEKVESYTPSKEGHIFKGWYLNNQQFNFDHNISENILLEARFENDVINLELIIVCVTLFILFLANKPRFMRVFKKSLKKLLIVL